MLQALWASLLVRPRTYDPSTQSWGNVYTNLLDYLISAALTFYVLTVAGVFRLRIKCPDSPHPYRTLGHPFVPAFYILAATIILVVLFVYVRLSSLNHLARFADCSAGRAYLSRHQGSETPSLLS